MFTELELIWLYFIPFLAPPKAIPLSYRAKFSRNEKLFFFLGIHPWLCQTHNCLVTLFWKINFALSISLYKVLFHNKTRKAISQASAEYSIALYCALG